MSLLQAAARGVAETIGRDSWPIRRLRPVYESILNWSHRSQGISWKINGVTCRINPRFRQQLGQSYDPSVAGFLSARVRPGEICLNVGANVGAYVLQLAHWSRPHGRIVAFEPNPTARQVLHQHLAFNNLDNRVQIVPAAVGDREREDILYASGADGMSRLGAPNEAIRDRALPVRVPVVTLDGYCEAHRIVPDWLIMDVEGFELAALIGAHRLIRGHQLAGIVVEMHPAAWPLTGHDRDGAGRLLDELGLSPVPLTGQRDPLEDHGIVYLARAGA